MSFSGNSHGAASRDRFICAPTNIVLDKEIISLVRVLPTMLNILAKRNVHTLAAFTSSNVLLAFDYDGTLAPLASEPGLARMRPTTRRLLTSVASRYPCAVISGRSREDLAKHVKGVPVIHLSGNHGLEPGAQDPRYRAQVRDWIRQLWSHTATLDGVVIEDKTYSLTVHYRHARRQREALTAIHRGVRSLRGARSLGGIHAVSLVPRGAPTKGVALERARRLLLCDTAIFVGDDQTDEDAFAAGNVDRLLAIRVGARRGSRARYRLRDQQEMDDFLRALIAFRPLRSHAPTDIVVRP